MQISIWLYWLLCTILHGKTSMITKKRGKLNPTNLTNHCVALNGNVHMEMVHGALSEYWTVVVHIKQGYVNSCVITSETFSRSGLLSEYLKPKKR